ncbi:hypothetical protein [Streptomyces sp. Je 1-369]|uniref:hypothetical protein n=1 Tax=Streptomyces sp. Je 1-369 TaxID=2966192 RepID=UPI0022858940|nr:hypothetical protein [Streptomyces sp. Je 1-369]WAL93975.1 hypothetical protein NOO62_05350 [Streptomyces sp. Je 1-369]
MTDKPPPITPTRVIPAAAPLPARPPQPGEVPPWHTPPPPPAPPAAATPPPPWWPPPPAPGTIELRVTYAPVPVEPEPSRWQWLWNWLRPWQSLAAAGIALLPVFDGYSLATGWGAALHDARTTASVGAAYVLAGVGIGAALLLDRTGRLLHRALLVTSMVGALGVMDWWDPFLFLTGVSR